MNLFKFKKKINILDFDNIKKVKLEKYNQFNRC